MYALPPPPHIIPANYFDEEIQADPICHRGICHDHKETCETCKLHFETVSTMFQKHQNQYGGDSRFRAVQVFRVDNTTTTANFNEKHRQFSQLPANGRIKDVQDLHVVARNYFREFFFRNSHDGHTISQVLLEELLVKKIYGSLAHKPDHIKFSDKSKRLKWKDLWAIVEKDVVTNPRKVFHLLSKCGNPAETVRWAWHGTKANAVSNITAQNFQPSFKKRQVHGDGFYFTSTPRIARNFAPPKVGDDGKPYHVLLLCQVLLGHSVASRKTHGTSNTYRDYCYAIPDPHQINSKYVVVIGRH